jgi:DNA-directed RNA polymerase subunit H
MGDKKSEVEHELIPEHTKLSDKDAKALMKLYTITIREMPKILFSDPAIAHLDAKEGDIIKIKRNSRTAGEIVFYRGVVKD